MMTLQALPAEEEAQKNETGLCIVCESMGCIFGPPKGLFDSFLPMKGTNSFFTELLPF